MALLVSCDGPVATPVLAIYLNDGFRNGPSGVIFGFNLDSTFSKRVRSRGMGVGINLFVRINLVLRIGSARTSKQQDRTTNNRPFPKHLCTSFRHEANTEGIRCASGFGVSRLSA